MKKGGSGVDITNWISSNCFQPPIEEVPDGDWFCPACSAEGGPKERRTPNSGSAGKKKPFKRKSAWSKGIVRTKKKIIVGSDADENEKEGGEEKENDGEEDGEDKKGQDKEQEEQEKREDEEKKRKEEERKKRKEEEEREQEAEAMSSPRTSRRATAASTTPDQVYCWFSYQPLKPS